MEQQRKKRLLVILIILSMLGSGGLFSIDFSAIRDVDALRLFASGALFGIFLSTLFLLIRSRNQADQ